MAIERIMVRPEEAAELLGISRSTAYFLIKSGAIPARRVGARLRVPLEALRAWARREDEAAGARPAEIGAGSAPRP